MQDKLAAVILAAGQGTRIKSRFSKVLHPVAGKPMIEYSLAAALGACVRKPVVVVGHQGEQVRALIGERALIVEQPEQLGTGDAVRCARSVLENEADHVVVIYGDMPLIMPETLQTLVQRHLSQNADLTMLTLIADDSMGFGRIIRDENGNPLRIVEESEATPEQLAIKELNPGVYCFRAEWLWKNIDRLTPSPQKGEYYLTDLLEVAVTLGAHVETVPCSDVNQFIGINDRTQVALAERIMRDRIRVRVMRDGVTLVDPESTYIDADVQVDEDSVILPGTHLLGKTRIGRECRIGPNAIIRDSTVGDFCTIGPSVIEESALEDHVEIGPFCHLRPGAYLSRRVHLGNYAEVKNSRLGEGVHMGHFSYLGDAEVGARTNIGAGTITCNYDGKKKNRTIIGEDVFIGSDSMLVAPVVLGARSRTGAGAVVIKDIPAGALAVGVPARVIRETE